MQAGTTDRRDVDGFQDDRRPARSCRRAVRRPRRRPRTRSTARGSTSPTRRPATIVREIGLGLIALGIQPGERVCLLAKTRIEWTYCDFAIASAGGVAVPIYATNSPEECEWVAGNSESVAVICEDATQVAKIVAVRDRLPDLRTIVVIDPAGDTADAVPLDEVRARGRERDPAELEARAAAVTPADTFTIIYTSGTTGPPKGCVLTHGNYRRTLDMCETLGVLRGSEEIYLFLPLAHAFALLIQLLSYDVGDTIAYFGGDPNQIVAELQETKPTYLPSVPRIFEKVYTLVMASQPEEAQAQMKAAAGLGVKVRDMVAHGQPVPPELQAKFDEADAKLFQNVRAVFGGRIQHAVSGAAPIAPEILEFFYGLRRAGARGLRHDRDLDGRRRTRRSRSTGSARSASSCPASRAASPRTASCS